MLLLMVLIQLCIFSFVKITEIKYFSFVDSLDKTRKQVIESEHDHMPDGDVLSKKHERLHLIVNGLDYLMILQYWLLNYHIIIWKQNEGEFMLKGVDLNFD